MPDESTLPPAASRAVPGGAPVDPPVEGLAPPPGVAPASSSAPLGVSSSPVPRQMRRPTAEPTPSVTRPRRAVRSRHAALAAKRAQHSPPTPTFPLRGGGEQWAQMVARVKDFSPKDWDRIRFQQSSLTRRFAILKERGVSPTSALARSLAEEHRQHLCQFYDCDYPVHLNIADAYLGTPRSTRVYDEILAGLSQFIRDAIYANAAAQSANDDVPPAPWQ